MIIIIIKYFIGYNIDIYIIYVIEMCPVDAAKVSSSLAMVVHRTMSARN